MKNYYKIKKIFLNFFKKKKHIILKSFPVVLKDDPTLMFVNAGMNYFKNLLINKVKPINNRIANIQKCIRITSKNNDLKYVGYDSYHHTMFEMLVNWSF